MASLSWGPLGLFWLSLYKEKQLQIIPNISTKEKSKRGLEQNEEEKTMNCAFKLSKIKKTSAGLSYQDNRASPTVLPHKHNERRQTQSGSLRLVEAPRDKW